MSTPALDWPACNLCGGEQFATVLTDCRERLYGLPGSFDVQRCRHCGLAQTRPRPARQALREYYPPEYMKPPVNKGTPSRGLRGLAREACDGLTEIRARRFSPIPVAGEGDAYLEIGCGEGEVFPLLAARGWEVWGIEPSENAAPLAERKLTGGGQVIRANAEDAEMPRTSFQRIAMNHVIEHLLDPALVLRRARGWVAEAGTLLITCPNFDSWERRVFGRFWYALEIPRHLYHFTPSTLSLLLQSTGWRVRHVSRQHVSLTLLGTVGIILDVARGGRREFMDVSRARRPVELIDHIAYVLGASPCIEVLAEPA